MIKIESQLIYIALIICWFPKISFGSEKILFEIDTIDISVYRPITHGQKKMVRLIAFWRICNKNEDVLGNISTPWLEPLQRSKYGISDDNKDDSGNSNLIIMNSKDTLFPSVGNFYPETAKFYNYKRLNLSSGECGTGKITRVFDYSKFDNMLRQGDCYLVIIYDSKDERIEGYKSKNLEERKQLIERVISANNIEKNKFRSRREIYKKYVPIKRFEMVSREYYMTQKWWKENKKSINYYTSIEYLIRDAGENNHCSAVIILGMLGDKDAVPYIQKTISIDTVLNRISHYAIEALAKLHSLKAVPLLIECYLKNDKEKRYITGKCFLWNNMDRIRHKYYSFKFNMDSLKNIIGYRHNYKCDKTVRIREMGIHYLERLTGKTFGYDPEAPKEERDEAIKRWEKWWDNNKDKYLKEDKDDTDSNIDIFKERMKYY